MKLAMIACTALAVLIAAVLVAAHVRKICRSATVFLDHY